MRVGVAQLEAAALIPVDQHVGGLGLIAVLDVLEHPVHGLDRRAVGGHGQLDLDVGRGVAHVVKLEHQLVATGGLVGEVAHVHAAGGLGVAGCLGVALGTEGAAADLAVDVADVAGRSGGVRVAGAAGFLLGVLPVVGIRVGRGDALVAGVAVARILREVAHQLGGGGIQVAVQLVHQGGQIAPSATGHALVVAGDAELGIGPVAVVNRLLHVAAVAALLLQDIAGQQRRRAGWYPVQHIVGDRNVVAAAKVDAEAVSRCLIPADQTVVVLRIARIRVAHRGGIEGEGVAVLAIAEGFELAAVLAGGAVVAGAVDEALPDHGVFPRGVTAGDHLGQGEGGKGGTQVIALALLVGDLELHR